MYREAWVPLLCTRTRILSLTNLTFGFCGRDGFEAHGSLLLVESAQLLSFKEVCLPDIFYRLKIVGVVLIDCFRSEAKIVGSEGTLTHSA